MNAIRKLVFLGVILGVIALCAGCQAGLSEEEVRSIVQEEVTNQLSTGQIRGVIGQEVASQLANIDELTVSKLYITNESGNIVAQLESFGVMGGQLTFFDSDGNQVAQYNDSGLYFMDENQKPVSILGTMKFESGAIGGQLMLFNPDGTRIASLVSTEDGDGFLGIYDKYGQLTFTAP